MDISKLSQKLPGLLKKYQYAILVLAIGMMLMIWPSKRNSQKEEAKTAVVHSQTENPSQELEHILSQIQGVGKVQVLLTIKSGESTVYQMDEDMSTTENNTSVRKETVIITDSNRNQQPLVVQVLPPQYLGAVVVCQGAENATVRLAVVEAVRNATGLGADHICVLKMK